MAKKHPRAYPLEFRAKIVELARAGRRPEDLAVEFELSNQTIRNWIKQADLDTCKRTDGLTSEERAELFRLRKKVKQLTIEREILSKAYLLQWNEILALTHVKSAPLAIAVPVGEDHAGLARLWLERRTLCPLCLCRSCHRLERCACGSSLAWTATSQHIRLFFSTPSEGAQQPDF